MNTSFKILIAEDSEVVQMSIHDFLIKDLQHTYSVLKAYNGREACNMAYKHKPDIILIDIEMPVMDGIEAISIIKKNKEIAHIPIIVMSGTRNFKKAMEAGANDFLLKPINQYELLLRITTNIISSRNDIELKKQQEILANQQFEVIAQRDMILMQQNEMYEDIRYARAIQNAILSDPEILNK
ncbi:MAG TPA: response regulator, partial [Bacteroidales bacterium]|nr:response regulator [Bacteroidales bacterium]